MLFLLSLSCFAESLTIDVVQTYDPNVDTEDAAVFIVGKSGQLISTGKLRPKGQTEQPPVSVTPEPAKASAADFAQVKIPTQLWDGRQISIQQIEIFGTHQCPYCKYAEKLALEKFGKEQVKVYKIEDNLSLRQKSDDILAAVDKSNFNTVPRISVIDNDNMRWFIGGFSDFEKFVQTNRSTPITPQTVDIDQASAATNYAKLPVPTKRNLGLPIQADKIVQVEIFGAPGCPACVTAKALASNTFGAYRVKTYDIRQFGQYLKISNDILRSVGWQDTSMPRISVIGKGLKGPQRMFIGGLGQLQNFINSTVIGSTNARFKPKKQEVKSNPQQNRSDALAALTPARQVADFFKKRYRGQYHP